MEGGTTIVKFRCSECEKKIGVPVKFANRKIKCPKCETVLRVPEAQAQPVTPMRQETMVTTRDAAPAPETVPEAAESECIADDIFISAISQDVQKKQVREEFLKAEEKLYCSYCGTPGLVNEVKCSMCGKPLKVEIPEETGTAKAKPKSTFTKDLARLISPINSAGDAITFSVILILSILPTIIPYLPFSLFLAAGFIFIFVRIIIVGFISTFYVNVLLDTANGSNDLPGLVEFESYGELFRPIWQFALSGIYAFLPAIAAGIYFGTQLGDEETLSSSATAILFVTGGLGLFFWPMIILCIVLGDSYIVRPDKVIKSIINTIKPYTICVFCFYAVAAAITLSQYMFRGAEGDVAALMTGIASQVGGLTINIYAMRVLGLLYRYYGNRLDW